jgi:23S rRNA (pseudouridine1915-N3)-methyltransferase
MRVTVGCVGRPKGALAELIGDYEKRIAHYYRFESIEIKEAPGRGQTADQVMQDEGERLLARVPAQHELIALHRPGEAWQSERLARHLEEASLRSAPGVVFVIGGAHGLSAEVLKRADRQISLSAMTLPHELARLILTEQLYRAGTINRGEPYHKGGQC